MDALTKHDGRLMGRAAHRRGLSRVPALDLDARDAIGMTATLSEGRATFVEFLAGWLEGWDAASLAAEVEG